MVTTFLAMTRENAASSKMAVLAEIPLSRYAALNETTGLQLAQQLKSLNPDVIYIVGTASDPYMPAHHLQILRSLKQINWLPKAIGSQGGLHIILAADPQFGHLFQYIYGLSITEYKLRGPYYRAVNNSNNFEIWSSTPEFDSPMIFRRAYEKQFPTAQQLDGGNAIPLVSAQSLQIIMKLVEYANSDNADLLRQASLRLSIPSLMGQLQFDTLGRPVDYELPVNQLDDNLQYQLITPLGVGVESIYPLPTWDERIFNPSYYSTSTEVAVAIINGIALFYVVSLLVGIMLYSKHAVIKASTPLFCGLVIIGGMIMLVSTYFTGLYTCDEYCAVSSWLLTIGFTIMFSALFTKT